MLHASRSAEFRRAAIEKDDIKDVHPCPKTHTNDESHWLQGGVFVEF